MLYYVFTSFFFCFSGLLLAQQESPHYDDYEIATREQIPNNQNHVTIFRQYLDENIRRFTRSSIPPSLSVATLHDFTYHQGCPAFCDICNTNLTAYTRNLDSLSITMSNAQEEADRCPHVFHLECFKEYQHEYLSAYNITCRNDRPRALPHCPKCLSEKSFAYPLYVYELVSEDQPLAVRYNTLHTLFRAQGQRVARIIPADWPAQLAAIAFACFFSSCLYYITQINSVQPAVPFSNLQTTFAVTLLCMLHYFAEHNLFVERTRLVAQILLVAPLINTLSLRTLAPASLAENVAAYIALHIMPLVRAVPQLANALGEYISLLTINRTAEESREILGYHLQQLNSFLIARAGQQGEEVCQMIHRLAQDASQAVLLRTRGLLGYY